MYSQGSNFRVLSDFFFKLRLYPQHVLVLVVDSGFLFSLFILKESSSVYSPPVEEGWLLYLLVAGCT